MTWAGPSRRDAFAQLLRGEPTEFAAFGLAPDEFLQACRDEDLVGLVYERVREQRDTTGWPDSLRAALAHHVRAETAAELVRRMEVVTVLDALSTKAVRPLLLKGTPLAYMLYDAPHLRPRCDTDLLIPRTQLEAATATLRSLGYAAPPYCDGELLFGQVVFVRTDAVGIDHVIDVHWKISTQAVVADLLTYDDISVRAISVPALGPAARTAGLVHALLLACLHGIVHTTATSSGSSGFTTSTFLRRSSRRRSSMPSRILRSPDASPPSAGTVSALPAHGSARAFRKR